MVGHDLYEVSQASGNLNEDWHVDQIRKMVKQSRGNEGRAKVICRGYSKINVVKLLLNCNS